MLSITRKVQERAVGKKRLAEDVPHTQLEVGEGDGRNPFPSGERPYLPRSLQLGIPVHLHAVLC